ncbi:MAG: rRNA maturation RNase YbeY [bacterium]|nr:rRNA maturation RNase YbeY [bacterium]
MRIQVVDRRGDVPVPDPWAGPTADWPRLESLAADLGAAVWRVDLVLVDDPAMADLNRRWRDGDGVTDVLSFSYLEESGVGAPELAVGRGGAAQDLWSAPETRAAEVATVGEIVLAPAFVLERCLDRGWDPDLEWPLLVVHGLLHLLGWEHDTDVARAAMQESEADILGRAGLAHPLREGS